MHGHGHTDSKTRERQEIKCTIIKNTNGTSAIHYNAANKRSHNYKEDPKHIISQSPLHEILIRVTIFCYNLDYTI